MSAIACGYLLLILSDLFLHIDIMYLFIPYVIITLIIADYTRKRSRNYNKYFLGFELELNGRGHLLKFFIFTFNHKSKHSNAVTLKYNEFQTSNILDLDQVRSMISNLGYILIIPHYVAQSNAPAEFYKVVNAKAPDPISVCEYYYEDILFKYKQFKPAVIYTLKQNLNNIIDKNSLQQSSNKKRSSLTSFLRR